jgi:beta-glucanase (GH16 family)
VEATANVPGVVIVPNPTLPSLERVNPTDEPSVDATPSPSPPEPIKKGWYLVLNESFDSPNLNTNLWNTRYRWGTSNPPELEHYTPEAVEIQNGVLRIKADKNLQGNFPYSSGLIASDSRFTFKYGYIEFRAKVPKGQGLWPALWLLAQDPKSAAEIDVMEILGQKPDRVYTTLHYGMVTDGRGLTGTGTSGPDYSQEYHTYAVDWRKDKIIWYIDGQEVFQATEHIPLEPMYIIANLAVGGDWPGPPSQDTQFPAFFDIKSIHVFMR